MTDYTPDTTTVRNAYVRTLRDVVVGSTGELEEEFDRWLSTVRNDAEVAAQALEDALSILEDVDPDDMRAWLSDRAASLRDGAGS